MEDLIPWLIGGLGAFFLISKAGTSGSLTSSTGGAGVAPAGSAGSTPNGDSTGPVQTTSNGGTVYPYVTKGAPNFPTSYNQQYYLSYIYPNMVAANPNVTNPNYSLTPNDAAQYLSNYADLDQWAALPSTLNSKQIAGYGGGTLGAARFHWANNGVPEKRTFLWLYPPDQTNYVAPAGKASSGSTFTTILKDVTSVAGAAIALAGPNDPGLNNTELELIVTGGAVVKNMLPLFANADNNLVTLIDNRLDQILTFYS